MSDEDTNQTLKDILEELKRDNQTDQLLGDMKQILEDTFKLHQNVEIKTTERFMDIKSFFEKIIENQKNPLMITFQEKTKDEVL